MLWRILAIPVILVGIAGLFLPLVPGVLFVVLGVFMLLKGRLPKI